MFLLVIISGLTKRSAVERGRKVLFFFASGPDVDVEQRAVRRGRPR